MEPSPWTTSVFNMLEYSIRGVFNKWGNTVIVSSVMRTVYGLDKAEDSILAMLFGVVHKGT